MDGLAVVSCCWSQTKNKDALARMSTYTNTHTQIKIVKPPEINGCKTKLNLRANRLMTSSRAFATALLSFRLLAVRRIPSERRKNTTDGQNKRERALLRTLDHPLCWKYARHVMTIQAHRYIRKHIAVWTRSGCYKWRRSSSLKPLVSLFDFRNVTQSITVF